MMSLSYKPWLLTSVGSETLIIFVFDVFAAFNLTAFNLAMLKLAVITVFIVVIFAFAVLAAFDFVISEVEDSEVEDSEVEDSEVEDSEVEGSDHNSGGGSGSDNDSDSVNNNMTLIKDYPLSKGLSADSKVTVLKIAAACHEQVSGWLSVWPSGKLSYPTTQESL